MAQHGTPKPPAMRRGMRNFRIQPGAHAEVAGITGRGHHSQRATLVVSYPDGKARTIPLANGMNVRSALRFATRFNAACGQMGRAS